MKFNSKFIADLYFSSRLFLGSGSEGMCYKFRGNQVAKIFSNCEYTEKELLRFQNIDVPNFAFVRELIYLREKIIGAIYPYVAGKSLKNQKIEKFPIMELCAALEDIMPKIKMLSEQGIKVDDIAQRNTIYRNGCFSFIDTVCYQKSDESPDKIFEYNCKLIMRLLMHNVLGAFYPSEVATYLNITSGKFKNWDSDMNNLKNPVLFILMVQNSLEDYLETNFSNFYSANMLLSRRKNQFTNYLF